MSKKVLITGSSGMLGLAFSEMIKKYFQTWEEKALSKEVLNVDNYENVMKYSEFSPDVIIHCAAIVNADFCETNYEEAYKTIVQGTENIVKLAEESDAVIVYPQSFLIFDGSENPVIEDTQPNPLSVYGKLKVKAEETILNSNAKSLIIRMGGFFGGYAKDKNFVGKILPDIFNKINSNVKEIEIGDRVWQPTYTEKLAYNCLKLIEGNKTGFYTMASKNKASFYDLTIKIVEFLGLDDKIKVRKVSSKIFDDLENAKRPKEVFLSNQKLDEEKLNFQENWEDSLKEYLSNDYFKNLIKKELGYE